MKRKKEFLKLKKYNPISMIKTKNHGIYMQGQLDLKSTYMRLLGWVFCEYKSHRYVMLRSWKVQQYCT